MLSSSILRIAVPSPLYQSFDYLPPLDRQVESLLPGIRVRVPFGPRELVGILLEIVEESGIDHSKLRVALDVLDTLPILSENLLKLMKWASSYYHHPIGEVVLGTLPKLIREGRTIPISDKTSTADSDINIQTPLQLNSAQQVAVEAITQANYFQCFLLDGITGSGKTEVYLQSIAQVVQRGKQALILVPEIGLTPQTLTRFSQRFSVEVMSYHSGLTEKQRFQTWTAVFQNKASIVIGTRSALFLPFNHLGLMILDEEHDLSFKQQAGFRYSARDCAVFRAQLDDIPIVLGSATPSLESSYNVQRGRYQALNLPQRAGASVLPKVRLINLCQQQLTAGLSSHLLDTMRQHLAQKGQVLLFLNRRGFAPAWLCHQCGWIAQCDRCDAKLILHQSPRRLRCHHCDATRPLPKHCAECNSTELMHVGQGTEQLEHVISELFPQQKIVRIDRDSTRAKGSMDILLEQAQTGEADILIGTQMLAKGHHFPALTMVAIVDADGGLFSTDFRAVERMGQLIVQVSGRAGREQLQGEVLIQTHQPEHPLLQILLNSGYQAFVKALLQEREQAMLPPFSHCALLRAEALDRDKPLQFLEKAKAELQNTKLQVLGPIAATLERKAGRFRAHLLLQAEQRPILQKELGALIQKLAMAKTTRQVRWSVDVDPQEGF